MSPFVARLVYVWCALFDAHRKRPVYGTNCVSHYCTLYIYAYYDVKSRVAGFVEISLLHFIKYLYEIFIKKSLFFIRLNSEFFFLTNAHCQRKRNICTYIYFFHKSIPLFFDFMQLQKKGILRVFFSTRNIPLYFHYYIVYSLRCTSPLQLALNHFFFFVFCQNVKKQKTMTFSKNYKQKYIL